MNKKFRAVALFLVIIMLFGTLNISGYTQGKLTNEESVEDEIDIVYPQGVVEYI